LAVVFILAIGAASLIFASWQLSESPAHFLSDLLLNFAAGLVITLATYVVLNPLFEELRTATITEHPRLDREALIQKISNCRDSVAILETWTDMLEEPYKERFVVAIRTALGNNATVRILLLDPDSAGTRLRTQELHERRDVQLAILSNLRHLGSLMGDLNESVRPQLEVRTYVATPAIQMYRWDDKAYISFFPLNQSNFSAPQIEAYMTTPLGEFVQRRFDDLWDDKKTVEVHELFVLHMQPRLGDRLLEACDVSFVELNGIRYVTGMNLIRQVFRHGIDNVTATFPDSRARVSPGIVYTMDEADDLEPALYGRLLEMFAAKYGIEARSENDRPFIFGLKELDKPSSN
jgi:hypothetical protein